MTYPPLMSKIRHSIKVIKKSYIFKLTYPLLPFLFLAVIHYGCVRSSLSKDEYRAQNIYEQILSTIQKEEVISSLAHVNVVTSHGHYPTKAVLILKRPSFLHLEILSPVGLPDYYLVSNVESIRIFIPSENQYYCGKPTAENLLKFFPWHFDIEDMVMILTGAFPVLKEVNTSYRMFQEAEHTFLEIKSPVGGSQLIELGKDNHLLTFVQNDRYGKEIYRVKYDKYENRMPLNISVQMADGMYSISVKYLDPQIEKNNDLNVFNLPVPQGIKPIILD